MRRGGCCGGCWGALWVPNQRLPPPFPCRRLWLSRGGRRLPRPSLGRLGFPVRVSGEGFRLGFPVRVSGKGFRLGFPAGLGTGTVELTVKTL
eukprot:880708-Prorocentrum_minimum.AAC.1